MQHVRFFASALALAAALAWTAPAAAGAVILELIINGKTYQVQGALPPPGAEKAIIIIGGKRHELIRDGKEWVTADGKLPDPGSAKGMIIYGKPGATQGPAPHLGNAPGGPKGDLAAKGFIIINSKKYEVQGPPPPPGAEKVIVIVNSKKYELTKDGDGWKTTGGNLPAPGSTKGVIVNWVPAETVKTAPGPGGTKGIRDPEKGQSPPGGAKALDDMPGAPKASPPPEGDKARSGFTTAPEADKALGGPDTKRGVQQSPQLDKSRRGVTR